MRRKRIDNNVIDLQRRELIRHMDEYGVPEHIHQGIVYYILHRIEPGGFVSAVICNDLKEAVGRADQWNLQRLPNIVKFFYMYAPSACWGSKEKFEDWLKGDNT